MLSKKHGRISILAFVVLGIWACGPKTAAPPGPSSSLAQDGPDPWSQSPLPPVFIPPEIIEPAWMESRRQDQLKAADSLGVFHDFRFIDRRPESGIDFVNRVVDDAGKYYVAGHYDHGNGLAVADVDGDGRYDLYFCNQVGSNQLWRNLGDGRFENSTARAGVALKEAIGVSASFADVDNDGDADLYATTVRGGNVLFLNDGDGVFTDATQAAGLSYTGHSSGAVFFDYNRDGLLDLFLVNVGQYTLDTALAVINDTTTAGLEPGQFKYYDTVKGAFGGHLMPDRFEPSILYKNLGGARFADVTDAVGLHDVSFAGDASPLDANADGWPDLYVLNMQGHDQYYENDRGQRFIKKSRSVFPKTPWGSMGIKSFDFDNDGQLDLFLTDMHSDMSDNVGPEKEKLKSQMKWDESFLRSGGMSLFGNAFYRNLGGGRFEEIADQIGAENYWPWGLSVGDLNADGWDDAFIASSMNYPFRYGINSLLLNDRGQRFVDSEFTLGVEPRRGRRTAKPWFELDCNGADYEHKDCEFQSGRIVVWGALGSRASALLDLDGDGDLDIVTNDFNSAPMVLVSDLAERKKDLRYLQVRLIGRKSNRDGLGALVRVKTRSGTYVKVHDGQSGYLSQSLQPLYFGLGVAKKVDGIQVEWPSGIQQEIPGPIKVNRLLEITEPDAEAQGMAPPIHREGEYAQAPVEMLVPTPYHVYPGQQIQPVLEQAAQDPRHKRVVVHAGIYRPQRPGQALIWFNARHDGVVLEAAGEVILTAANPDIADTAVASFPAVVNHVVYFGDGITPATTLRGVKITGANHYLHMPQEPTSIEPSTRPGLTRGEFFYADGGGIKIFGQSAPTIERVEVYNNYTSPCGAGVSVEHQGFNATPVRFKDCIFRGNRTQITGAAVDLLQGSAAVIENCLFVGNIANLGVDYVGRRNFREYNKEHGSGALTVFPQSVVWVRDSTFTGNWNGVDDKGAANVYANSIFWMNNAVGGISPGPRYELDVEDGGGITGCFIHGVIDDLRGTIDPQRNRLQAPDPHFDAAYRPQAEEYIGVGYRPIN